MGTTFHIDRTSVSPRRRWTKCSTVRMLLPMPPSAPAAAVHTAGRLRLGALDKPLVDAVWAVRGRQFARERADLHIRQPIGPRKGTDGLALERHHHHVVPERSGTGHAGDLLHPLVIGVANPDADDELGRVPDRPVVAKIGRRPGLDRGGEGESQYAFLTEGGDPRPVVAEDVGDQIGHPLV